MAQSKPGAHCSSLPYIASVTSPLVVDLKTQFIVSITRPFPLWLLLNDDVGCPLQLPRFLAHLLLSWQTVIAWLRNVYLCTSVPFYTSSLSCAEGNVISNRMSASRMFFSCCCCFDVLFGFSLKCGWLGLYAFKKEIISVFQFVFYLFS